MRVVCCCRAPYLRNYRERHILRLGDARPCQSDSKQTDRIVEVQNDAHGFRSMNKSKANLPDYLENIRKRSVERGSANCGYGSCINDLNTVRSECYRGLHDGCRLCTNIGDQFARSVYYGRYEVIPTRTEIIRCESLGMHIWERSYGKNKPR